MLVKVSCFRWCLRLSHGGPKCQSELLEVMAPRGAVLLCHFPAVGNRSGRLLSATVFTQVSGQHQVIFTHLSPSSPEPSPSVVTRML